MSSIYPTICQRQATQCASKRMLIINLKKPIIPITASESLRYSIILIIITRSLAIRSNRKILTKRKNFTILNNLAFYTKFVVS